MKDFIKINENDNVIVAIKELAEGEKVTVDGKEYTAAETIPAGHKMAICDIPQGGDVIKYGFRIGNAKENIKAGQWVHSSLEMSFFFSPREDRAFSSMGRPWVSKPGT